MPNPNGRKGSYVADMSRPKTLAEIYQQMNKKMSNGSATYGGVNYGTAPLAAPTAGSSNGKPGQVSFAGVSSSVDSTAQKANTTTTASGPSGGVAPPAGFTPTASGATGAPQTPAATPAANSLQTGGGYASSMGGSSAPATARDEAVRQAAAEKQRQQQVQQQRQVEAQSQRLAQTDQEQMSRVGDILQKSLDAQLGIQQNTADTVTMLREILKRNAGTTTEAAKTNAVSEPAPSATPRRSRPIEDKPSPLPVSMRYRQPNG